MKRIKILTSFDDAKELDMELADMLLKYNMPAVFYIPLKTRDLMDNQLRRLAGTEPNCDICKRTKHLFELGAHTMTHPREFQDLSEEEVRKEVVESKEGLEMIIGKKVTKFCYPRGRYNDTIKRIVKEAGFEEARTVEDLSISFPKDPFETRPTIHVHPAKHNYGGKTWLGMGEELLEKVLEEGGRFELWGHSWEVNKYHHWEFLDDFLYWMDKKMKEINYPRDISKELKI